MFGHEADVECLAFHRGSQLLSVSADKTATVFSLVPRQQSGELKLSGPTSSAVARSAPVFCQQREREQGTGNSLESSATLKIEPSMHGAGAAPPAARRFVIWQKLPTVSEDAPLSLWKRATAFAQSSNGQQLNLLQLSREVRN
jgi:hypothetical protein